MRSSKFLGVLLFACSASMGWGQGAIRGEGTTNTVPKFTGSRTIGDSALQEVNGNFFTLGGIEANVLTGAGENPGGFAVLGQNRATTGESVGVFGQSFSRDRGIGVRGGAGNENDPGFGVLGETGSPNAMGVHGFNGAASGQGVGVFGVSNSPEGVAVLGTNNATTGSPMGVQGGTSSTEGGIGVRGGAYASSGPGIGVLGETNTPDGTPGVFNNGAGGNILLGLAFGANRFRVDGAGGVFASGYNTGGADFAESVQVALGPAQYQPGDVMAIDPSKPERFRLADRPYSATVAGIYSTKPGILASTHKMDGAEFANEIPMAVVGIVPCKVTSENGPIGVGDLLVSSSTPGHAMKGTDRRKLVGAVVGKALEPLRGGKGVVRVLVTLQ